LTPRQKWVLAFLGILALAGLVRVAALQPALSAMQLLGDEFYYARVAVNIAVGRGHVYQDSVRVKPSGRLLQSSDELVALRPPAYPWLLSHWVDTRRQGRHFNLQDSRMSLLRAQLLLGTALVALTVWLGSVLFEPRTGLLAGAIAAVYPPFVAHSHYLWSENLFGLLITLALIGVVVGQRRASRLVAAASGAVFGVAALTREIALPVAAVCVLWAVWTSVPDERRAALVRGAAMMAVALAVVLPWTLRNQRALDRFVPVSTIGWFAAAEGNALDPGDWLHSRTERMRFKASYLALPGELERMDFAREQTLANVRAEQPLWILKKAVRNLALLLRPDTVLFYKLERGGYADPSGAAVRALLVVTVLFYSALLVAAVLGVAGAPDRARRLLPCLVLATVASVHVLANATARFRVPWMPLAMVYASYALLHFGDLRQRLRGPVLLAPLALLLFYVGVCIPHFSPTAAKLWAWGDERGDAAVGASMLVVHPRAPKRRSPWPTR
jgi:4-amino-4-deoxy-L-arabinose transferase-like glycosyltransferase